MKYSSIFFSIFLGAMPAIYLFYQFATGFYGAEPTKAILHFLGDWSIYFLLGTLGILWFCRLGKIPFKQLPIITKIFGNYAFLYALGHIFCYILFEQGGSLYLTFDEIARRIYLLLGMMGFLCLVILNIFSIFFSRFFPRFSALIYPAGFLGSIHYLLGQKIPSLSSYGIFFAFFILLCVKLLSKNKDKK
ncbi:ferric reductase-like transmembrane domain-containing protein [Helicobacter sp. 11S02596-1]|uniref:ferric reductase-like transmembrane domain-containing protein n=1 Tax=Helicobacter sp. 11S02596-1 TaxID=1476194 RepID=UPI000BA58FA8|nr:ferric reductase-like transmembrane domain-containing protein [Helicobacter sp. 11S02596-1]PAF41635.1 hypothetical protein BJI48_08075 [Helicobacter sp. 11S02596-1]